jgi:hypothetical protein
MKLFQLHRFCSMNMAVKMFINVNTEGFGRDSNDPFRGTVPPFAWNSTGSLGYHSP